MLETDFETDKESERQWIVSSAEQQREKWPPESAPHPGYKRRSARSWYHIGNRLAAVQEAYDSCDEFYPKHLIQRALMAIWPAVMPYRWPPSRKLSRRQIKQARSRVKPGRFQL